MKGRSSLLCFIAATGGVHLLPTMPDSTVRIGLSAGVLLVTVVAAVTLRRKPARRFWLLPLWAALAGGLLTCVRIDSRLNDRLAESNVNLVSRVELRVTSLPQRLSGSQQFDAQVIRSMPVGVPEKIRVSWRTERWQGPYARPDLNVAPAPAAIPGQVWRMALVLKPPHGARNPHGFDYESHIFASGIRAIGTVRGTPVLLRDEPWHNLSVIAQRARYRVREAMLPHVQGKRYGAVLLALAIGDQASVDSRDWEVFHRTGITHLVSISGTHVTLIAGFAGMVMFWLWRRVRIRGLFLAERFPAQIAGAWVALLIAWLYCLLAGWGVPAQRTFLMLAVVAFTYVLRLSLSAPRILLLAAFVVILLDPWAILSNGFWLSFGAVAVLIAVVGLHGDSVRSEKPALWRRVVTASCAAGRLQLLISAALLPPLAWLFHEVSIVSPIVNAYAIPVVSLLVTPLALIAAITALLPGTDAFAGIVFDLTHVIVQAMMWPTQWMAERAMASVMTAAAPVILTFFAVMGLVVVVMPRGLPLRLLGWSFMLPALTWVPARPTHGGWDAVVLDVGQASATVIQTARHDLLFDAGIRQSPTADSGSRIIWPFFRSIGIKKLDAVVISHADIDHAGGLRSLLDVMHVEQSYSSFGVEQWLRREASLLGISDTTSRPLAMTACRDGQRWEVDGVVFHMIWPLHDRNNHDKTSSRARNDRSCVLRVEGRHHSLLLTGDINAGQETELVQRGIGAHDVVLAGHHGSNSSSDAGFIQTVQAKHVIAQAGAWSRYGHPHPAVIKRWRASGAKVWRTDQDGAVSIASRENGLRVLSERHATPRYWQNESADEIE